MHTNWNTLFELSKQQHQRLLAESETQRQLRALPQPKLDLHWVSRGWLRLSQHLALPQAMSDMRN